MTREEAIRQIENRWSIMDYGESEALGEALDMAIEALSVANLKEEFESAEAYKAWTGEEMGKTEELTEPTDRPHGEWIPCSEKLPKEKAIVLTYDTMGDVVFGQYDKGKWYWEAEACADYWAKNDGVIAWMPLPTQYKGGDTK